MAQSLVETYRFKKLRSRFLIFLAACVGFSTIIYMPIKYLMESNIVWQNSALMLTWMEVVEPLMLYTFYLGSFAFCVTAILRYGFGNSFFFAAAYAVAVLLRYFTGLFSYMWTMGAIRWSEFFAFEFWQMIFSIAMDWVQMGAAWLLTYLTLRKCAKGQPALDRIGAVERTYLPMERVWAWKNPLFRLSIWLAVIPSVLRILSRIYYDLIMIFAYEMGVSGAGEVIVMISYYITDLLTILVGGLLLSLLFSALRRQDEKDALKEHFKP